MLVQPKNLNTYIMFSNVHPKTRQGKNRTAFWLFCFSLFEETKILDGRLRMLTHIMRFMVGLISCALLVLLVWLSRDYAIFIVFTLMMGTILLVIYTIGTFIDWTLEMRDY